MTVDPIGPAASASVSAELSPYLNGVTQSPDGPGMLVPADVTGEPRPLVPANLAQAAAPLVPANVANGTLAANLYGGVPLVVTAAVPRPDDPPAIPLTPPVDGVSAPARLRSIDTYA